MTAPRSSSAMTERSSVMAGMPPTSPAAMTGSAGGERRQTPPGAGAGGCAGLPGRLRPQRRECRASAAAGFRESGRRSASAPRGFPAQDRRCPRRLRRSIATHVEKPAETSRKSGSLRGTSRSWPRRSPHRKTSWVNSKRRRSSGMAGSTDSPSSSTDPSRSPSSSESRSPIGRIRGSSSGAAGSLPVVVTRRKVSRSARTARRVGSKTVARASDRGSPPPISRSPAASVARNGRSVAIV